MFAVVKVLIIRSHKTRHREEHQSFICHCQQCGST